MTHRSRPTLTELDAALPFVDRHIGLRDPDIARCSSGSASPPSTR